MAPSVSAKRRRVQDLTESDDENRPPSKEPSKSSLSGKLQKLLVKNFMNHAHLEVTFGPRVNFVTGRNGSGKSAVVTALLVGLGGRATITQRGTSIKSLIRKGEQSATVQIHLSNEGIHAFDAKLFGRTIVVERTIRMSGGGYKIMSSAGRIVATKFEYLQRILEHFDINIDNPTTILTQDMSREFLASADPKKLYAFFKQATRLAAIESDIRAIYTNLDVAKRKLDSKSGSIAASERELKTIEDRLKICETKQELEKKIQKLGHEKSWIEIRDLENAKAELEKRINTISHKATKKLKEAQNCEEEVERLEKAKQDAEISSNELHNQVKAAKEAVEKAENEQRNAKKDQMALQNLVRNKKHEVKRKWTEIGQLEAKVRERQAKCMSSVEQQRAQLEAQLAQVDTQIARLLQDRSDSDLTRQQFDKELEGLNARMADCNQQLYRNQREITGWRTDISKVEAQRGGDRLRLFGRHVPEIVQAVQRETRFTVKPLGPIGAYVKCNDPKYDAVVETVIGRRMTSFLCDNAHDTLLLRRIIDRLVDRADVRNYPAIITQTFSHTAYDTSNSKPGVPYPTILDVISVSEPVVANVLMDSANIEQVLVFDRLQEARDVIMMGPPVPNCIRAVTLCGAHVSRKKCFPGKLHQPRFFVRSNADERVKAMRRQIEAKEQDNLAILRDIEEVKSQLVSNHAENKRLQEKRSNIDQQLRSCKHTKTRLEHEVADLMSDDTLQVLIEEIEEDKASTSNLETEIASLEDRLKQSGEAVKESSDELARLQIELQAHSERLRKAHVHLEGITTRTQELLGTHRFFNNKVKEMEETLSADRADLDLLSAQLSAKLSALRDVCPDRVTSRRTAADVDRQMAEVDRILQRRIQEVPQSHDTLRGEYDNRVAIVARIKAEMESTRAMIATLEDAVRFRQTKFASLRDTSVTTMTNAFQHRLSLHRNGYSGGLSFDHEAGKLQVWVKTRENSTLKDNSQLSGGERSFTTVCFITALWSAVADCSPFKILDEFDVFMDMVNRRMSMDYLLEFANRSAGGHSQFIFLTPLDISRLEPGDLSRRVFRMPDPDRRIQQKMSRFLATSEQDT